jgi:GntR family transcriptional regulator
MELTIDLVSPVPVYEQIRAQITELVESGTLGPGVSLPSVRQLAADFGIAPGTVARSYRELRANGVVRSSRAGGTRIASPPRLERSARAARLSEAVERFVGAARRLGAADEEVREAVATALARGAATTDAPSWR